MLIETLQAQHDSLLALLGLCGQGLARKSELQEAFHRCRTELLPLLSGDGIAARRFQRGVELQGSYWVEETRGRFAPDVDCLKIAGWVNLVDETLRLLEPALDPNAGKSQVLLPAGDGFRAQRQVLRLLQGAQAQLTVVDQYLDEVALDFVASLSPSLEIRLLAGIPVKPILPRLLASLRGSIPRLEARCATDFHDRFIVIDSAEIWQLGCSLNGLGKKTSLLTKVTDPAESAKASALIADVWSKATILN